MQNGTPAKPQRKLSISLSMPSSPVDDEMVLDTDVPSSQEKQEKYYSQPMTKGVELTEVVIVGKSENKSLRNPRIDRLKDERFDPFKTWSGKLERQFSNLRGKHQENERTPQSQHPAEIQNLPVARYFDALEGPELDTLRVCFFEKKNIISWIHFFCVSVSYTGY